MSNLSISSAQLRAAAALLNWENKRLAEMADVSVDTITDYKNGKSNPQKRIQHKIRQALEVAGIEFLENDGLRMRSNDIEIYKGVDRFDEFSDFMYLWLKEHGGSVCVSVTDERQFQKYRKNVHQHRQRMIDLVSGGRVDGRILAAEGDFKETWAKLRKSPAGAHASRVSFYVFGPFLALISFEHENPPYVALHKSGAFADAFRQTFDMAWESAAPS